MLWAMSKSWSHRKILTPKIHFKPKVSLLIACRNEEQNILRLLNAFDLKEYHDVEVVIIDDQSEDQTFSLARGYLPKYFKLLLLQSPKPGKKQAISYGVSNCSGEVILCTDADCFWPKNWVWRMVSKFEDPKIQFVAGSVLPRNRSGIFQDFQSIEWASILLVTQFSFARREPLMCSAANMAYRKAAFQELKGYEGNEGNVSGDDEFLLKKMSKTYQGEALHYLPFSEVLVETDLQFDLHSLLNQRIRWASKWRVHRSFRHAMVSFAAFGVQLLWIASVALLFLGAKGILAFSLVWTIKIFSEKLALGKVLETFGRKKSVKSFIWTSIYHPFFVLNTVIGVFKGKFSWKGRGY